MKKNLSEMSIDELIEEIRSINKHSTCTRDFLKRFNEEQLRDYLRCLRMHDLHRTDNQ
jgi:hypothetical protein